MLSTIFDILFPKFCLSCNREGLYVCPACFAKIPLKTGVNCPFCRKRVSDGKICAICRAKKEINLTGLLVASEWNNLLIRQMIYECKYRFVKELTVVIASVMTNFLKTQSINFSPDKLILIPVPLHKRRLTWRGFNQAELIAEQIAIQLKIEVNKNLIIRCRHTSPQMEIKNEVERIKNVVHAFMLNGVTNGFSLEGKIVILVDDVCTTAATMNECATALKPLHPKEIWGLVLARG